MGDTRTSYSYDWWDGALIKTSSFDGDTGSSSNALWTSTYSYDVSGFLSSVGIVDGRPRTVSFVTGVGGQVLQRDEADGNAATGDPREFHYYFNGVAVGDIGNNGTSNVDYVQGIREHTAAPGTGPFRNGSASASGVVDFDQSYDSINGLTYESTAGRYTVADGDSLQSMALALWGDASLWYLIAEANGLGGAETLVAGQALVIPNKIHNFHNNADTFRPYDPNDALGNLSPNAPKPVKKNNGCGIVGQILLIAVAVAVAAVLRAPITNLLQFGTTTATAGATVTAGATIAGGVLAGAAGSIVSQGLGVATGLQDSFSWKSVAIAGISAGAGAGAGRFIAGEGFLAGVARGVAANVVTQGVAVATGLQNQFDWTGVAVAGIAGGFTSLAGKVIGYQPGVETLGNRALAGVAGAAGGIAAAASQSLIEGTDFGDNLMAVLPSAIGNTIGNMVAGELASRKPSTQLLDELGTPRKLLTAENRAALREYDRQAEAAGREAAERVKQGEFSLTAETSSRLNDSLAAALEAGAKTPYARAKVDDFYDLVAEQFQSQGTAAGSQSVGDAEGQAITVTADPNKRIFMTSELIDGGGIALGSTARRVGGALADAIAERPGLGLAIRVADTALTVWGGPLRYAGGKAYEAVKGGIQTRLEGGFAGVEYSNTQSADGASGIVLAGSIVLSGLGSVAVLGRGAAETTGSRIIYDAPIGPVRPIHKNSLSYVGDTHVYVIRRADGSLHKVGESAQGVRVSDGASVRAEQQARALQRETGDVYRTQVRQNFDGKADARAYETRFIQTYERLYGKRPSGNPLDR